MDIKLTEQRLALGGTLTVAERLALKVYELNELALKYGKRIIIDEPEKKRISDMTLEERAEHLKKYGNLDEQPEPNEQALYRENYLKYQRAKAEKELLIEQLEIEKMKDEIRKLGGDV